MIRALSLVAIALGLIGLSIAPRVLASDSGRTASMPAAWSKVKLAPSTPSTNPGTPPSPTAVSSSPLAITGLWAYTDGIRSKTLYVGHHTDLYMAYRIAGAVPSGSRVGTISVVVRGATIFEVRRQLPNKPAGSISVHLAHAFQPGIVQLSGSVQMGKDARIAHRKLTVLDPSGFLLRSSFTDAGVAKVRASRIESNNQAQREHYVIHWGVRPFSALGRQTGTFEALTLTWPHVERSQIVVQATLVSMFGTVQQSRAAYRNEMQQYQLREGCGSGCAFRPQAAPAAGSFGHSRTAFNLNSNAGVTVRQTLFVRGSIVVETWTYNTGLLSSPMSKQLTSATTVRLQELDSVARAQQAG